MTSALQTPHDPMALSNGLTARTRQLSLGLESGAADILDLVTPTTADLLRWWFGEDMVAARGGLNFHAGQKQAILNAIVAHEVLGAASLQDLYQQVAPDALLAGTRLAEVSSVKHAHPKYCFKMATGTGKTWVLQALLIWQLLNKNAALAEGRYQPERADALADPCLRRAGVFALHRIDHGRHRGVQQQRFGACVRGEQRLQVVAIGRVGAVPVHPVAPCLGGQVHDRIERLAQGRHGGYLREWVCHQALFGAGP